MQPTFSNRIRVAVKALIGRWQDDTVRSRRNHGTRLVRQDEDLAGGTRERLMSEARRLRQTFGLFEPILDTYARYCVHPTSRVQFITSDDEWNRMAEDYWRMVSEDIDIAGEHDMSAMLGLGLKSYKCDGDVFFVRSVVDGLPRLQAIESDRVADTSSGFGIALPQQNSTWFSGIKVSASGRREAYRVWKRAPVSGLLDPREVPASEVYYLSHTFRFDAVRGVTAFHGVIQDIQDLHETKNAEQLAAKIASYNTIVEKNATGSPSGISFFSDNAETGTVEKQLETIDPGMVRYMFPGDSAEMFRSERPAEGWRWLIEFLIRGIANALQVPYEFVWNVSGPTGPGIRMVAKQAERTFSREIHYLERRLLKPTVRFAIETAMANGALPINPDYRMFRCMRPAMPSIDVGRETQSNLSEYDAGVLTADEITEERGHDASEIRRIRKREADEILVLAKELVDNHQVTFGTALALLGAPNMAQQAVGLREGDEPESESTPSRERPSAINGQHSR